MIEWRTPVARNASGSAVSEQIEVAHELECWQEAAARHLPFNANCLDRALALWWLLRRRGIAAELRIGGRKKDGEFEAHAWVDVGGTVVDGATDEADFAKFQPAAVAMETQPR